LRFVNECGLMRRVRRTELYGLLSSARWSDKRSTGD
jgi:hypothetical protein